MKALRLNKPHVLVMIGAPYSGKSEFASKFSETFRAPFINAKLFQLEGCDTLAALNLALNTLVQIQKTNQTIIYEGISGSRAERTQVSRLARQNGYETLFIWVQTDPSITQTRATKRTRTNQSPLTLDQYEREMRRFTQPSAQEPSVVISGMHTYASQARAVLKRLSAASGRSDEPPTGAAPQLSRPPRRPHIIR